MNNGNNMQPGGQGLPNGGFQNQIQGMNGFPPLVPFRCECGQEVSMDGLQQHLQSCRKMNTTYHGIVEKFVTLKNKLHPRQPGDVQGIKNLFTLLSSFCNDLETYFPRQPNQQNQRNSQPRQNPPVLDPINQAPNQIPVARNSANHVHIHEEVKEANPFAQNNHHEDVEMDDDQACVYCKKRFTQQELESGLVNMLLSSECYHQCHVKCFQKAAQKQMLTSTVKNGNELEFNDPTCGRCHKVVQNDECRELLGSKLFQEIENARMEKQIESNHTMCRCECGALISSAPSAPDYSQKDEKGQIISREAAEHMAIYRVRCPNCSKNACTKCNKQPYHVGLTCEQAVNLQGARRCRFCQEEWKGKSTSNLECFKDVCDQPDCQEAMKHVCQKILPCGCPCNGLHGETKCLPCLNEKCLEKYNNQALVKSGALKPINDNYDSFCSICYTDGLRAKASVQLDCGHVFHVECILKKLKNRWFSPRIVFGFLKCPACNDKIMADHIPAIKKETREMIAYEKLVMKKALERGKFEDLDKDPRLKDPNDAYYNNLQEFSMFKLAYYQCFKCKDAYFGGKKDCLNAQGNAEQDFKPEELICPKCAAGQVGGGQKTCAKHGTDFIDFKCKFCCSVAQWFCWGSTHFCDDCHKRQCKGDYVSKYPRDKLPKCPGLAKCPLKVAHPPNGEEYSLGCSVCRNMVENARDF